MKLITDFYKNLDTLNLIIFWGIIIVIILLLIFSCILINKNKKLKKLIKDNNDKYEEEIPIKIKEFEEKETIETINEKEFEILPPFKEKVEEPIIDENNISKPIETEQKFVAEEHVMEYNKELPQTNNIKSNNENKHNRVVDIKPLIEIPSAPYQRNVLREMSLSQTSPIGINRQENKINKKIELAKDLEDSLSNGEPEILKKEEIKRETVQTNTKELDTQLKKELTNIEHNSPRKTEIRVENKSEPLLKPRETYEQRKVEKEEYKTISQPKYDNSRIETPAKELLNSQKIITEEKKEKSSSEKYLEEVSRKLAEAEIPDEIERTNYELQQEEDAIISYKELMEKKDSIQTIDEEDAVISIEELMNRNNQQQEEQIEEDRKLYNLTEEEGNDNFIKELKQFRNDL